MIDSAAGISFAHAILSCCQAAEPCARFFPADVLLRITLQDMLPWILLWIAIAGITRLFARSRTDDHETSGREDDWDD